MVGFGFVVSWNSDSTVYYGYGAFVCAGYYFINVDNNYPMISERIRIINSSKNIDKKTKNSKTQTPFWVYE